MILALILLSCPVLSSGEDNITRLFPSAPGFVVCVLPAAAASGHSGGECGHEHGPNPHLPCLHGTPAPTTGEQSAAAADHAGTGPQFSDGQTGIATLASPEKALPSHVSLIPSRKLTACSASLAP